MYAMIGVELRKRFSSNREDGSVTTHLHTSPEVVKICYHGDVVQLMEPQLCVARLFVQRHSPLDEEPIRPSQINRFGHADTRG